MAVLTKHTGAKLRSISGPLSLITKSLGGDKKVIAIELNPEQWHLEHSLFEALDLLASMVEKQTATLASEKIRRLSEFLVSDVKLPPSAIAEATMRADTVRHLIEQGKWLTAAEIARKGDYSKSNPAAPANRWKKEGKVYAVTFKGQDLFAAYQFDKAMKPLPVIANLLKALRKNDPWKIAAWFGSANGWLRGKRPQDCLENPVAVLEAAKQETAGFDG
jgi:hypothetical protein